MSSDALPFGDLGLLTPVSAGHDHIVSDAAVLSALVRAECALVTAYEQVGVATPHARRAIHQAFGTGEESPNPALGIDIERLSVDAAHGGNPVIPLVGVLKERVPAEHRVWIHRGATSQDILDTALMMLARQAMERIRSSLTLAARRARHLAVTYADDVAAARTLTQHAVPTTIGARAATWARGIERAVGRIDALVYPAQLGGAGGTLASFVEVTGSLEAATALPAAFARAVGLDVPEAPWHVTRWPITELGDSLAQAVDAVGKVAADVAVLSRTEIGELSEGAGGGSSAMPQKQNPTEAVLIRSAALRAPQLAATLHLASALAVDERPDGAWHAEWPTLRDLLRIALGAAQHSASVLSHLRVDVDAASRHAQATGGRIVSERLRDVLVPLIGTDRFAELIASDADVAERLRAMPETAGLDVDALVDPRGYLGLAPRFARGAGATGARTAADRDAEAAADRRGTAGPGVEDGR
ncbi:lyase family protein [Microbacterium sp. XT11]|uniref:lyase family protein n=1 Tax=Microbacterium sp. XT11 TaxID=367477 RepID=UPI0009FB31BC|nr:lyase family protein [Microbacterium sp. XT11]